MRRTTAGGVLISNGFSKFHLAVAAAEVARRGRLTRLVTGAYPTPGVRRSLALSGAARHPKLARLLDRREVVPDQLLIPLWLPELLHAVATLTRHGPLQQWGQWLEMLSYRLYGRRARSVVARCASHAGIYHYRAGFGHGSVALARELGMVTLCDHSLAHPAVLAHLVSHRGTLPPPGKGEPGDRLCSLILQDIEQADAVLVNSDFVKDTFLHERWDPSRLHVIYLGVDDQFLANIPDQRDGSALPGEPLRLVFAGAFEQRKGAEILAQALAEINDLPWRLTIIGSVAPDTARRCADFLNDPRVVLAGVLRRRDLAEHLTNADAFVFPSLAEGSARVVFEALACGLYVITTPNSGSIVRDGVHGAVIPAGVPRPLAAAVREAWTRRAELADIGRRNAALIRERYRQVHYGDALVELYRKLMIPKPAAGSV